MAFHHAPFIKPDLPIDSKIIRHVLIVQGVTYNNKIILRLKKGTYLIIIWSWPIWVKFEQLNRMITFSVMSLSWFHLNLKKLHDNKLKKFKKINAVETS
jgi:hypothetical protein